MRVHTYTQRRKKRYYVTVDDLVTVLTEQGTVPRLCKVVEHAGNYITVRDLLTGKEYGAFQTDILVKHKGVPGYDC